MRDSRYVRIATVHYGIISMLTTRLHQTRKDIEISFVYIKPLRAWTVRLALPTRSLVHVPQGIVCRPRNSFIDETLRSAVSNLAMASTSFFQNESRNSILFAVRCESFKYIRRAFSISFFLQNCTSTCKRGRVVHQYPKIISIISSILIFADVGQ